MNNSISSSFEAFKKFFFGYHPKTKRSISEEAESGDETSIQSWLNEGADPNEQDSYGYTPLINASAKGRLKAVENLVKTALHLAIKENHNEIINELIKCGSNPRLIGYNNKSSIQCAKDAGLNALVKRLEN